ncbi:MAG: diphthamide synthesis protein [Vulcanisaeta sp. AZ3]
MNDRPSILLIPIYYKLQPELVRRAEDLVRNFVKRFDITVAYALPYMLYARHIAETFGLRLMSKPITGCFVEPPIPNSILFIGSGYFYPLTFKFLKPSVNVYLLDVFRSVIEDVEHIYRKYLSMKVKAIDEFRKARRVGIMVSRKPGQYRLDLVEPLMKRLRELGKDCIIIDTDEVSPDVINNLPVDAVINTACPRIGIDDLDRIMKPLVNASDALKRNMLDLDNLLIW